MKILLLSAFLFPIAAIRAQEIKLPSSFKTTSGIEIKNPRVTGRTEEAVKIMHDGGIATIAYSQLPLEILEALGLQAQSVVSDVIKLPDPLATTKGTYLKPELRAVEPDGIRIIHTLGTAKIWHEHLPISVAESVGPFDPVRATEFREAEAERARQHYKEGRKVLNDAQRAANNYEQSQRDAVEAQKAQLVDNPEMVSPIVSVQLSASATGGRNRDKTYQAPWGSHAWTDTQRRSMVCRIASNVKSYQRVRVQCLFFTKEVSAGRSVLSEIVADTKVSLGPLSAKTIEATATAEVSDENYVAIGFKLRTGAKYAGWSWRSIDGKGRITSVFSSNANYDKDAWSLPVEQ
jgi:hypothetical protein